MKKIYRLLSVLLHPVFLPMLATLVYLNVLTLTITHLQMYLVFFVVCGTTFIIPVLMLFLLKFTGFIKTIETVTIKERKIPVLVMMVNYLCLGVFLRNIWQLRDLSILTYAIAIGLFVTILLFFKNIKVSLHMLGLSSLLGFVLVFGSKYYYPIMLIAFLVSLSGVLATARLKLEAHNFKEIILGTLLGIGLPILMSFLL